MRRTAIAVLALTLAAWACGGSDGEGSTTTAGTAATTTTAATAAPTTTEASTTTQDATAARVAAAQELEGDYQGEWNNTKFGSTGAIEVSFEVDADAAFGLLTIDLGGNVFGASDPDAFVFEIDLTREGPYEGTSDLFGEFMVEVSEDGTVTLTAPEVPGLGGLPLVVEGSAVDGGFEGTYSIEGLADGTWSAAPAG